jgi:hypothetical protein
MYSKAEVTNFIQTYGALILSIYAIVQVWAIALWKRFIWKGKVVIFETGWIEVGFGGAGPLITLTGTLRAQRQDVFVQEVLLHLTRESDSNTFSLEWIAFKAPQIKIGDPTATTLELPSGINVRVDQPMRYSIVFCDKKLQSQINRKFSPIANEWKQFLFQRREKIQRAARNPNTTEDAIAEQYLAEFMKTSEITQAALKFQEGTNWLQSGIYQIKMEVKASSPDKTFSEEWMFSLDQELSDGLRANSLATLKELCLGKLEYFTASLEYIKKENLR